MEVTIGVLVAGTATVAARWTLWVALGIYIGVLAFLVSYAYTLYTSGSILKAKAFLAGLIMDLWGIALSTVLPLATAVIFDTIVFNILGIVASNLVEPLSLQASLMAANGVLVAGLTVALASLLIPEPSSIAFRPLLLALTLGASAAAMALLLVW